MQGSLALFFVISMEHSLTDLIKSKLNEFYQNIAHKKKNLRSSWQFKIVISLVQL